MTPDAQRRTPVLAALLTVQAIFGVNYVVTKMLLSEIEPRAWATIRIVSAALILVALALAARRRFPVRPADWGRLAFFSLFGVVINQVCYVEGLARTTPTHSAIINTTIPVSTLMFAVMLRQERLTGARLAALAAALGGVLLVVRPDRAALTSETVVGDALCLVNATSFAFFLAASRRLLTRIDPLAATAVLFAFGSLGVAALGAAPLAAFDPAAVSTRFWFFAAFVILFATAGTYLLNYWALARVDASVVALFIYVQPILAASLSALTLGERLGPALFAGGALVFVGVWLSVRRR